MLLLGGAEQLSQAEDTSRGELLLGHTKVSGHL